tara:strand:- start:208 stop:390 length:183 start_codon:yes stop_codon:yes gene_type:complete
MIPLFYPENCYWKECVNAIGEVLKTRWLGQAYKVDEFERVFAEINEGDEVIPDIFKKIVY